MAVFRKGSHARDGTVISLTVIATSIISCLSHIDENGWVVLASLCLEKIKIFCQNTNLRIGSHGVVMSVLKSGFIYGGVSTTFDSYDESSVRFTVQHTNLGNLQGSYADRSIYPSTEMHVFVVVVEEEEKQRRFAQVLILFHFGFQQIDKLSADLQFWSIFNWPFLLTLVTMVLTVCIHDGQPMTRFTTLSFRIWVLWTLSM